MNADALDQSLGEHALLHHWDRLSREHSPGWGQHAPQSVFDGLLCLQVMNWDRQRRSEQNRTLALFCSCAPAISSASNKTWIQRLTRSGKTLLCEARWTGNDH